MGTDLRKLERIVVLCTASDVERIGAYCEHYKVNRSEFIRYIVLKKIEAWENGKAKKAVNDHAV